MKRNALATLALALAMGMPMTVAAMSHEDHGKMMSDEMKQHGDMQHADQGMHMDKDMAMEHAKGMDHDMAGMNADDSGFMEIGKDTQEGVVATVKIKAYDEETMATMAKMGMQATHHVMVFFTDEKTGAEIAEGKAAIKVEGQEAKPAMMMLMGNGFGADVSLEGNMNTFEIGTKLADDNKRQFKVMYHSM